MVPPVDINSEAYLKQAWTVRKKFNGLSWAQIHFGIVYGHYQLIKLEPWMWPVCLLHMNLRIVNAIFVKFVVGKIGDTPKRREKQTPLLMELLTKLAKVYIKESKLRVRAKTTKAVWDKVSFAGSDAGQVHRFREAILEIIHPAAERIKHPAVQEQWENSMACWNQWDVVWTLLNINLEEMEDEQESRDKRADEVEKAALKFVSLWNAAHGRSKHLYLHILVAHVPAMIRRFGDLRVYQVKGLEHCHSIRKLIARSLTNRIEGQRLATTMSVLIAMDFSDKEVRRQHLAAEEHARRKREFERRMNRRLKAGKLTIGR